MGRAAANPFSPRAYQKGWCHREKASRTVGCFWLAGRWLRTEYANNEALAHSSQDDASIDDADDAAEDRLRYAAEDGHRKERQTVRNSFLRAQSCRRR